MEGELDFKHESIGTSKFQMSVKPSSDDLFADCLVKNYIISTEKFPPDLWVLCSQATETFLIHVNCLM